MNNNGVNTSSFGNNGNIGSLFNSNTNSTNNMFIPQGNNTGGSSPFGGNNLNTNTLNNNTMTSSNSTTFGLSLKPTNSLSPGLYNGSSINTRSKTYHPKLGTTQRLFEISTGGRDKEFKVHTINNLSEYAGISLDELRADDYNNIRSGVLPDNWKAHVRSNVSMLQYTGHTFTHLEPQPGLNQSLFSSNSNFNNNNTNNNSFLRPQGFGNNGFNTTNNLNNNNNNPPNSFLNSNNTTGSNNLFNSSKSP